MAFFFFQRIRRPPRSTQGVSSAASDVYKRQYQRRVHGDKLTLTWNKVKGAEKYYIYRSDNPTTPIASMPTSPLKDSVVNMDTFYVDTTSTLYAGKKYLYNVKAYTKAKK
eukprot:TRINITY_DN6610_c0_g1_i1.p3 TRINITY_DN6610_c0_g1~~TRINITY_DN6610_c0_g1_i1.p3  ORF type:complete len:110 (+),score=37.99 TRINITY_DN6610_c0_g1_i1:55-384(+)